MFLALMDQAIASTEPSFGTDTIATDDGALERSVSMVLMNVLVKLRIRGEWTTFDHVCCVCSSGRA